MNLEETLRDRLRRVGDDYFGFPEMTAYAVETGTRFERAFLSAMAERFNWE